ncbi:DUF2157 domain-containing protein [Cyanobium sp. Morenito 9A2]|uniref:DUF2157 domain-containing protein n=1 Tax=Cyanobium sp. Morenito 9A2 TaxID=2823718 RepID=UPI0020CCEF38|nr:DUF2157 domain-containing protein [Cyanobium sp. Morenito 9A2]MCP9848397.1 DUF2157 domain-containing protein [Cyanobium sp. Morenito 9A2]
MAHPRAFKERKGMGKKPHEPWKRWYEAGLIDAETVARIEGWERTRAGPGGLHWPIRVLLIFGTLLMGAGVLLFVAAHWENLSPPFRFSLALVLVGGFHGAGALTSGRYAAMADAFHALGSIALGAGIFLAAQIFHLEAEWSLGLLLWALGALAGWLVLGQWPQLVLVALLLPAWLCSVWWNDVSLIPSLHRQGVTACGLLLFALAYCSAQIDARAGTSRLVLAGIGRLVLIPLAIYWTFIVLMPHVWDFYYTATNLRFQDPLSAQDLPLFSLAWLVAIGAPLLLAFGLSRRAAWPMGLATAWVLTPTFFIHPAGRLFPYIWWVIGSLLMVGWGLREARLERINLGAVFFAVTLVAFYFSEVMDKLGRSASLVGLGALFLLGGWLLETTRRRLIARALEGRP